MQLATPPVLSWMPASGQELATPCGSEHIRHHVIPTTPRMVTTPGRSESSSLYPKGPSSEAVQFQHLLRMQSEELKNLMESLLLRQEHVIKNLLTVKTNKRVSSNTPLDFVLDSGVDMPDCKSKVEGNAIQTQIGTELAMPLDDEVNGSEEVSSNHSFPSNMEENKVQRMNASSNGCISSRTELASHLSFSRKYRAHELLGSNSRLLQTSWLLKNHRDTLASILHSRAYDTVMTLVIVFNSMVIIADTDANAGCSDVSGCASDWIWYMNATLLLVYTVESIIAIDVYRWNLMKERARLLDMFVVFCGFIDYVVLKFFGTALPSMQILKLVRLSRVLRSVRLFHTFPELQTIVNGFIGAMRAMLWGLVLLMLLLLFPSIVAVELLHDVNKEVRQESQYCEVALDSVWNATLLFFQIIAAGDSWGSCTMKIMKHTPPAFILFGVSLISVQVGFMNLIISVIIERVAATREADTAQRLKDKEKAIQSSRKKWLNLFETADVDSSGDLDIQELLGGFDELPDFRDDLRLLGIQRSDLPSLLTLMDEDGNKRVNAHELLSMLDMVWHFDSKMHQVIMSMRLRIVFQRLEKRLQTLEGDTKFMRYLSSA